jgi:hypothetical protein
MSKVNVVLAADCYVDKQVRRAGETVELPAEIAADFGTVQQSEENSENSEKSEKSDGDGKTADGAKKSQ